MNIFFQKMGHKFVQFFYFYDIRGNEVSSQDWLLQISLVSVLIKMREELLWEEVEVELLLFRFLLFIFYFLLLLIINFFVPSILVVFFWCIN